MSDRAETRCAARANQVKALAMLLCAWVLAGCTMHFKLPAGGSQEQFSKDSWICQRDANAAATHPDYTRGLYRGCMQARGYVEQ